MEYREIIGIDPDTEKSGVATLKIRDNKPEITLCRMAFPQLMGFLDMKAEEAKYGNDSITVVVEKGWFSSANYRINPKGGPRVAAAQGLDIGRNHETGRKIVEMARDYFNLKVEEVTPLRKVWHGHDGKITKEELESFAGPLPRCNQDERDAALLAWVYSGLPIVVKPL